MDAAEDTPPKRRPPPGCTRSSSRRKTVSLKKSIIGLTLIRDSPTSTRTTSPKIAPKLRRPDRVLPQPGAHLVDADRHQRARLSEARAAVVAERRDGRHRREDAASRDGLAREADGRILARLERAGMTNCAPKLNQEESRQAVDQPAPRPKLANEKPKGETFPTRRCCRPGKKAGCARKEKGRPICIGRPRSPLDHPRGRAIRSGTAPPHRRSADRSGRPCGASRLRWATIRSSGCSRPRRTRSSRSR